MVNFIKKNPRLMFTLIVGGLVIIVSLFFGGTAFLSETLPYWIFGGLVGLIPFFLRFFKVLYKKAGG